MATAVPEAPHVSAAPQDAATKLQSQPQRHSHKSWRKKYYKMRHDFQKLMARNHMQFEEEQKAIRMARRLQEQNDQMLDLIHDLNNSPRVSTKLRYDIRSPVPSGGSALGMEDHLELEDALAYNPSRALTQLETKVPHSSTSDLPTDPEDRRSLEEFIDDELTGYLSPVHEENYLAAIDAYEPTSINENTNRPDAPTGPWSAKDPSVAAAKNPVSVYNWLRKHNPELLESNEKGGAAAHKEDKAPPKAAPTKVMPKRASVGAKHEYGEVLDDDGTLANGSTDAVSTPRGPGRGKRRIEADEDGAYRPKGGSGRKKKKMSVSGEKAGASGLSSVASANDGPDQALEP